MSDSVRIVEVGPRDGLQNEKTPVGVADRIAFIEARVGAGLHTTQTVGLTLATDLTPAQTARLAEAQSDLRGVDMEEQPVRNYRDYAAMDKSLPVRRRILSFVTTCASRMAK